MKTREALIHSSCRRMPASRVLIDRDDETRINRRLPGSILAGVLLLLASAISHAAMNGSILWYLEQEAGIEPYKVRYLVTDGFMRSDEGDGKGGFALFNRKTKQVYSVVPEDRTMLRINGQGQVPAIPRQLNVSIKQSVDAKAPRVADKAPVTVELLAGDELCYTAVVVPGFPGPARAAFQEFAESLAVQQMRTLENTPVQYRTPCFLSRYLYAADFHVQRGVPLVEWNDQGERRELIDYQIGVELDERLFVLPEGYELIRAAGQDDAGEE
ncbi:MAG: hypothetical protein ACE5FQ_15620 [Thiogranum sp.]